MLISIDATGATCARPPVAQLSRSWRIVTAAVTAGLLAAASFSAWGAEPEIVANVNGESVTRADLRRVLANPQTLRQLQQQAGFMSVQPNALDRLALKQLVHRHLLLQEARRRNLTVSEKAVDLAVSSLRRRFTDLKSFGAWMKEQGLDERSLFESVRSDMLADRMRSSLQENVSVTEDQIRAYYETHQEELKTGEQVRLRMIAVKDKTAGEEIMAELQKGKNFAALARERSLGMRAAQGGDAGWVDVTTLWEPLRSVVGRLKPRQAIGPLRRGDEFLIVRLEERRAGQTKSIAELHTQIERTVLLLKQREAVHAWLAEQEKKSKIDVFLLPS